MESINQQRYRRYGYNDVVMECKASILSIFAKVQMLKQELMVNIVLQDVPRPFNADQHKRKRSEILVNSTLRFTSQSEHVETCVKEHVWGHALGNYTLAQRTYLSIIRLGLPPYGSMYGRVCEVR